MNADSAAELEKYLHEHIPLSKAMQVTVVSADAKGIILQAPLEPNLNHRGTAFGGSVSTLGILSAWSYLHSVLGENVPAHRIVIQSNEVKYLRPIISVFTSFTPAVEKRIMERFKETLARKGKARITLEAVLSCEGVESARFSGEYVALASGD